MEKTLFPEYVAKYFAGFVGAVAARYSGAAAPPMYLHKQLLAEEYSADLRWDSTAINGSVTAADVVSLGSSLPLKRRGTITRASGTIPKLGVKMRRDEWEISSINVMRARGATEAEVAARVFNDVDRVVRAIEARKEIMFQAALSTGQCLVGDGDNVGTAVRASFGYAAKNAIKSGKPWASAEAKPIDDLKALFGAADAHGVAPMRVYLSRKYFDLLRGTTQGKLFGSRGAVALKPELLLTPGAEATLGALREEFGAEFCVVDGSFLVEGPEGAPRAVKPWAEASVVALPGDRAGRLVYGTLAEETAPVAGVAYVKAGSHILVAKYSRTDPLEEYTSGQALCLPVIDGAGEIFTLQADQGK